MPGLHHPVAKPFRCDGQPVQLPRQTDGKITDIDHFLHFASAFGRDFARLYRDQPRQIVLVIAQGIAEQPDKLAAARRGNRTPLQKCLVGLFHDRLDFGRPAR